MTKKQYYLFGSLLLLVGVLIGVTMFMKSQADGGKVLSGGASSATGVTSGTIGHTSKTFDSSASSTYVQLCNTSGIDRVVINVFGEFTGFAAFTGSGSTGFPRGLLLEAGTTTASNSGTTTGSSNKMFSADIATTTGMNAFSTSSPGQMSTTTNNVNASALNRVWQDSTCINFVGNSTGTFTGVLGVDYFNL